MRPRHALPVLGLVLAATLQAQVESDPWTDRITLQESFPIANTSSLNHAGGTVTCPTGSVLITGGAELAASNGAVPSNFTLVRNYPDGNGWTGYGMEVNEKGSSGILVNVMAVCGYLERSDNPHIQVVAGKFPITYSSFIDNISGTATCPSGTTVISGGARLGSDYNWVPEYMTLYNSRVNGNGWTASARETYATASHGSKEYLWVTALCADAASGISNVKETTGTVELSDNTGTYDVVTSTVGCPSGKTRFGGGAQITTSTGVLPDYMSLIHGDFKESTQWIAMAQELSPNHTYKKKITASILCGDRTSGVTGIDSYSQTVEFGSGRSGFLDHKMHTTYCPSGKTLLGGGYRISSHDGTIPARMDLIAAAPFENGWRAHIRENSDETRSVNPVYLTVTALCGELPE